MATTITLVNTNESNTRYNVPAPSTLMDLLNIAKDKCKLSNCTLLVNGETVDSQATYDRLKMTLPVIEMSVVNSDKEYNDVFLSMHSSANPLINY
jgi:hypothetical protein